MKKENHRLIAASLCASLAAPTVALADTFALSHGCYKPSKPFGFTSQYEVNAFRRNVEVYRNCIMDFVEEQREAITTHQEAAQDAIDEWNWFVDHELQ